MLRLSCALLVAVSSSVGALAQAPPLVWPSWLVRYESSRPPQPVERRAYGETYLESSYRTSTALTDLHQFYEDLVQSNGYMIVTSQVTVSQTAKGNLVAPEPYGFVEACRSEGGKSTGPRTCVKASYSGNPQKKPITVRLTVKTKGGQDHR